MASQMWSLSVAHISLLKDPGQTASESRTQDRECQKSPRTVYSRTLGVFYATTLTQKLLTNLLKITHENSREKCLMALDVVVLFSNYGGITILRWMDNL